MSGSRPRAMLEPGDDVLPRLRDLVMRCPCAVLEGIRWSVVCKVYTDRYEGGPISASTLDAAKSSLADLVVFDDNAQGLAPRGTGMCTNHIMAMISRRPLILRFGQCLLMIAVLLFQQAWVENFLGHFGQISRCARRAMPPSPSDMPTVEELDDSYPDLGRREVAILAKGENWAVVYNPSGAAAHWHRDFSEKEGFTLLGRAKRTLRRKLHLVGRLDRSVSGLSLLAFDPETAEALQSVNASKVYYALCRNSGEAFFDQGRFAITRPLRDKKPFGKKHGDGMKESHTDVEVLFGGKDPNGCLIRAEPKTGRYHQIRRHLRNISLPILGDGYCKRKTREYYESFGIQLPRRVLLHLYSIRVPATGKTPELYVTCPLPPNFQRFIRHSACFIR
eukprot:symbB.v1.2.003757.t1/scaffold207.1/size268535/4